MAVKLTATPGYIIFEENGTKLRKGKAMLSFEELTTAIQLSLKSFKTNEFDLFKVLEYTDCVDSNGDPFSTFEDFVAFFDNNTSPNFNVGGGSGSGATIELPSRIYKYTANTYADLLLLIDPIPEEGDIARVYTSTGIWGINRKNAGAYTFLSGVWVYGSESLQYEILQNDADILALQINKADITYVDAEILKKNPSANIIYTLTTANGGATLVGTSALVDYESVIPKSFYIIFPSTLTSFSEASTININGTGAKIVTGEFGAPISRSELALDRAYHVIYNSVRDTFEVQGVSSLITLETEFITGATAPFGTTTLASGSFIVDTANATSQHVGCRRVISASGANSGIAVGAELGILPIIANSLHQSIIKYLCVSTNGFTRGGFLDNLTNPATGVYYEINHTSNSISFISRISGVGTTTNVLSLVATNKWFNFKIEINPTNVVLTVSDDTLNVLETSTITTNIPYSSFLSCHILSYSASGAKDLISVDYLKYKVNVSR